MPQDKKGTVKKKAVKKANPYAPKAWVGAIVGSPRISTPQLKAPSSVPRKRPTSPKKK